MDFGNQGYSIYLHDDKGQKVHGAGLQGAYGQ